ncbi:hypothetical protein V2J09_015620 [Rumex salicifolius]
MRHHVPAAASPATPISTLSDIKRGKKRGSYSCGRCGLPKKGHVCNLSSDKSLTPSTSAASPLPPPIPQPPRSRLPRALSFDDVDIKEELDGDDGFAGDECEPGLLSPLPDLDPEEELSGGLPAGCLWEVLRRLPPSALLSAARVCNGWRECSKRMWRAAEELRLRVPPNAQISMVGSVLKKCSSLARLSLRMESDLDATMLACIAFSCPNLESMEIYTSHTSTNLITGDELGRFVTDKRCLSVLKMEGCSNLGAIVISSSSLSTLWLSDLRSLSKTVFNCPNLSEVSLVFSHQENDTMNLTSIMDNLGRCCPRLKNIHVASTRLSHTAVLALTAANLRSLRMLSLVMGAGITDASVAAITSRFSELELLDLSGSSISDSGIGMICNVYPQTLSRLLLALCPNVSSNGIQFATAQLPLLELVDCGMTICDPDTEPLQEQLTGVEHQSSSQAKLHLMRQKLIIKHNRLKKLSLWGCSGLDALYLNCPELGELNMNSCTNLHPDKLLIQCPNVESVHAFGCHSSLIQAIESQVDNSKNPLLDSPSSCKRMADGSKRIRVPDFVYQQEMNENGKGYEACKRRCTVIVD